MELPQSGEVIQTAVLNVTDVVKAKTQPGRNETMDGKRNLFHIHTHTHINDPNESCRCFFCKGKTRVLQVFGALWWLMCCCEGQ